MRSRAIAGLLCAALSAGCGARSGLLVPSTLDDAGDEALEAGRDASEMDAADAGPDVLEEDAIEEDAIEEDAGVDAFDEESGVDVFEEDALVDAPADVRPDLTIAVPVCNELTTAGNRTPETNEVDLGRVSGTFSFEYDARSVADRFIVSYEGRVLFDSGCVTRTGTTRIRYAGISPRVSVEVIPNCAGTSTTSWTFTVHCPD